MTAFLAGLIAIIVEALVSFFTSQVFMKAVLACMTYVFLFTIIPLLIQFLVPPEVMKGLDTYMQMLQGGGTSLSCSGSAQVASAGPTQSVSCNAQITMVQFGQGVAYLLDWFCAESFLAVFLPVLAVSFLFRRI